MDALLGTDSPADAQRKARKIADAKPCCPFLSGEDTASASLPPDHPRIPATGAGASSSFEGKLPPALPPALAETVRTLADRGGQGATAIAAMLKLDVAAVDAVLEQQKQPPQLVAAGGAGVHEGSKVVGDPMQLRLDALLEEAADVCCPVTLVLMVDPVKASAHPHAHPHACPSPVAGASAEARRRARFRWRPRGGAWC